MMSGKLKKMSLNLIHTAPFVLSNTVILVPYLLFIGLSDGESWLKILPFVLFYTFRMTGIFLIRGLNVGLDSFRLLMVSFFLGGAGSLLGILGSAYFPLYILSGILMGLSAAWLQPANITVNFHEKQQGFVNMKQANYLFALVLLVLLFWGMSFPREVQINVMFSLYAYFYLMAVVTVKGYPDYPIKNDQDNTHLISRKELIVFSIFFVLLLLLRSGRLLFSLNDLDIAIVGFSVIFIISIILLGGAHKKWRLPIWLNLLTFINGMIGNFLFLFGSLYVGAVYGFSQVATHLYMPYALGVILAMFGTQKVTGLFPKQQELPVLMGGLCIGFMLLMIPDMAVVPWLVISFFRSGTSSWLNNYYYKKVNVPVDQRLLVKFTTQNKGSLTHQFLLMTLMLLLAKIMGESGNVLLELTGKKMVTPIQLVILDVTKWLSAGLMLLALGCVYLLWRGQKTDMTGDLP